MALLSIGMVTSLLNFDLWEWPNNTEADNWIIGIATRVTVLIFYDGHVMELMHLNEAYTL